MALAHKVVHCTIMGTMFSGGEEWQTGFYLGAPDADAQVPNQAFADVVRNAWQTFFTLAGNGVSDSYNFTGVKLARLGLDGKYDGSAVIQSFPTGQVTGGSTGLPLPPQVALVATLIAGSGKGLGGKGRMYLPGIKHAVTGNGRISDADALRVANNLATFFNTINASTDKPGTAINASRGHVKFGGAGAVNITLNGIRVGNVYDTQRRRRNGLSETYQASAQLT